MARETQLLICIMYMIWGCQHTADKHNAQSLASAQIAGTWYGSLPCADCMGINYKLILGSDNIFRSFTNYYGTMKDPVIHSGKWQWTNDSTLVLMPKNGQKQYFRAKNALGALIMLDKHQHRLSSAFGALYELTRNRHIFSEMQMRIDTEKVSKGIDFIAYGYEPAWTLEIDFDKMIHFKTAVWPGNISTPVPASGTKGNAQGERYRAVTEAGELVIMLVKENCEDTLLGEKVNYQVSISVKKGRSIQSKVFGGCGRYLLDYRLHNIWKLESMLGIELDRDQPGKNASLLELNVREGKVLAYNGCNTLQGDLEVKGTHLIFSQMVGSQMPCQDSEMSQQFLSLLNTDLLMYHFEAGKLTLKRGKQTVMQFIPID